MGAICIHIDLLGTFAKALTFAAGCTDPLVIAVTPFEPNLHGAAKTIQEIHHLERAYQAPIPSFPIPHFILKSNLSPRNNNKTAHWLHAEVKRMPDGRSLAPSPAGHRGLSLPYRLSSCIRGAVRATCKLQRVDRLREDPA